MDINNNIAAWTSETPNVQALRREGGIGIYLGTVSTRLEFVSIIFWVLCKLGVARAMAGRALSSSVPRFFILSFCAI